MHHHQTDYLLMYDVAQAPQKRLTAHTGGRRTVNEHQPAIPSLANACMHARMRANKTAASKREKKKQSEAKSNLRSSSV